MKGAISAILEAARLLQASGVRPACNLEVSLVCDEETGSELGAAWLVREGIVKPDFVVVCEGGSGKRVCIGHNGTLWYEVSVLGRSAHASTPERGVNAFEQACDMVAILRKYATRLRKRRFVSPDGYVMRSTLNIGGFAGTGPGAKINTVPNHFVFTIDRRVLPSEKFQDADRELLAVLAGARNRIPGLRYKTRCLERNLPCLVDRQGSLPTALIDIISRQRRSKATFAVSTGFNDMHWFAAEAGIPVVGYGPGGERFHGVDERARVKDLVDSTAVYARLMAEFSG
jgi:succinyl-diaminopimelate desuccinylase